MLRLAVAAGALDLVGARLAVRLGMGAEPLRVSVPPTLPRSIVLAGWGTALSGPLLADVGLSTLACAADSGRHEASGAIRILGWLRLTGVLAEPATWGRRRPRWVVLMSAGHMAVAVALIRSSRATDRA